MGLAVAPVGERHIIVDADEVDRRRGPETGRGESRDRPYHRLAGGRHTPSSRLHRKPSHPAVSPSPRLQAAPAPRRRDSCPPRRAASSVRAIRCRSGRHRRRRPARRDARNAGSCGGSPRPPARRTGSTFRRRRNHLASRSRRSAPPAPRRRTSASGVPSRPGAGIAGDAPAPGIGAPARSRHRDRQGHLTGQCPSERKDRRRASAPCPQIAQRPDHRGVGRRAAIGRPCHPDGSPGGRPIA